MAAFGLDQLLSLNDPQIAVDQQALQRRMEIAQALRRQAMAPVDTSGRQIGGMGYRISPLEGVAKMIQAFQANRQDTSNDADRLAMAQRMGMALKSMAAGDSNMGQTAQQPQQPQGNGFAPSQNFAGANPDFTPAIAQTVANAQPAPQTPSQPTPTMGGNFSMPNLLRSMSIGALGGDAAQGAFWKNQEIPDAVKTSDAYGQNRGEIGALTTQKLRKEATNPTPLGRTHYIDQHGDIQPLLPQIPGQVDIPDITAPGGFRYAPATGAAAGLKAAASIPEVAKAEQTTQQVWDPTANDGKGGMVFKTAAQIAAASNSPSGPTPPQLAAGLRTTGDAPVKLPNGNYSAQVPPQRQQQRTDVRRQTLVDELRNPKNTPGDNAAIQKELSALPPQAGGQPFAAAPPPGAITEAEAAATNRQSTMKDEYTKVSTQSSTAQDLIAKLQSIKQAAPGATLGPGTDRRDLLNGILALGGFSAAKDAATASSLVDQNAADIARTMGGNQAATVEALHTLTGNPRSMVDPGKVADTLIAPLQVYQDRAALVTPHYIKGDAGNFLTKKQAFDTAADPRLWEWKNIQDPTARAEFAKSLATQDPSIMGKLKALEGLGVSRFLQ